MADTGDIFAALDVALFERHATGLFEAVGITPAWCHIPDGLIETYPLLELFLSELDDANWTGQSDIWTELSPAGDLYLQAIAATLDERRFIAIRLMPPALFTYQQLAHDFQLSEQKIEKLNRELARATQAKSDFLAAMSHEIRTPLNAIIGMADVLSGTALTLDQQKCVEVFQRNGVSLLNLINDILDLSKVESGRVELESIDMDLRDVISRAMEVVEARATNKGLYLRRTITPGVPVHLIGDPNRLRQIVINLLGNSIKFTDKGGLEVLVTLEDPRGADTPVRSAGTPAGALNKAIRLRFGIRDTGIGIPEDKLSAIFESFTQVDASTTRKYGGTGLGLTISKQLVELMDGRIWVESTLDAGSTFYFTAGFGVQENPISKPTIDKPHAADLSGARILLADDSEDNRYLILSYLKNSQAMIDIAENGEEAVRKFKSRKYDVILMDVEMPIMDGTQATSEIRAYEKENALLPTPVLALTAHAFADMAARSLEAGFTAVLTKPIRKATLIDAVARALVPAAQALLPASPAAPKTLIAIEPGLEDIVPAYLAKRRADLATYRAALAAADFDTIKKLAHKMKGTGAGYGFPALTGFGAALEASAIAADAPRLAESLAELAVYLESIELKYS